MECYKILSIKEVEQLLRDDSKSLADYVHQLPNRYAVEYRLNTGEVILASILAKPDSQGIVFENEQCFKRYLALEAFPIENDDKQIYEYDLKGQRNIKTHVKVYQQHLNTRLGLSESEIDKTTMEKYYYGVLRLRRKEPRDILALGAVLGELLRRDLNGRWVLERLYGTYNPYYKPLIAYDEDNVQSPYDKLMAMLERKEHDWALFFNTNFSYGSVNDLTEDGRLMEIKD